MTGSSFPSGELVARLIGRVVVLSVGVALTLAFYAAVLVVQNTNADHACETVPKELWGEFDGDIKFEPSLLNLGGRCTYHLHEGSPVVTREPGWWLTETAVVGLLILAGFSVMVARWRGHPGWLHGVTTFVAPPLGLLLAVTARERSTQRRRVSGS